MIGLFYLAGVFGLLASGCALYNMVRADSPTVFWFGVFYAIVATVYFLAACLGVALA
jgi:hypothetical protein